MARVTLLDVSKAAGVSRATASLVVRGSSKVAPETAARVRAAMAELGYVYDRAAANMRQGRSRIIGLIMTNLANPFFAEFLEAFEEKVQEEGYTLFVGYSHDDLTKQQRLLSAFAEHRVDGVALLPAHGTTEQEVIDLEEQGIKAVLFTRHLGSRTHHVSVNNFAAGQLLAKHLSGAGISEAVFVGGQETSSRRERIAGLKDLPDFRLKDSGIFAVSSPEAGAVATEELLAQGDLPQCIIAYNDVIAIGVYAALRARGIPIGTGVAVASFDDVLLAAQQVPPLTSVASFPREVGTDCAQILLDHIHDDASEIVNRLIEPKLQVRASTVTRTRN